MGLLCALAACHTQPAAKPPLKPPVLGLRQPSPVAVRPTVTPVQIPSALAIVQERRAARHLYFASNRPNAAGGGFDIYVYDETDRTVRAVNALNTAANEVQPQLSPDGDTLAYCSDESGDFDVKLHDLAKRRTQDLRNINTRERDQSPSFSQDSQTLTFTSTQNGRPVLRWYDRRRQELYEAQVLNAVRIGVFDHSWSDDQDWVYFAGQVAGAQYDLLAYDLRKSSLYLLPYANTDANETSPALSSDGRQLLFTSDRRGELDVYGLSLDSGVVTFFDGINTAAAEFDPRFAADTDRAVIFQSNRTGQPRIYRYELDTRVLDTLPLLSVPGYADLMGLP